MKLLISLLFTFITPLCLADTSTLSGRDIAVKMDQADTSQDSSRTAMMLIERRGQKLVRKLVMWAKKYGEDDRSLIRFEEPADVRATQYLSWVYEDLKKADDMWVFFPTDNLVRRISGGGKKGAFMRSDFSNEDLETRAVDDDKHILLEEVEFQGRAHYVVESTPISEKARDSNYAKRKLWVDKEYLLATQIEFYDRRERLLKVLKQGGIQQIDGIWTATKIIMETPRKKTRTLMQYEDIQYDMGIEDDRFLQSNLKR